MTAPERELYSTDGALCPHCGCLNNPSDDNYELYSEDTCRWECGDCGTDFNVSVYVRHSWTTKPVEGEAP